MNLPIPDHVDGTPCYECPCAECVVMEWRLIRETPDEYPQWEGMSIFQWREEQWPEYYGPADYESGAARLLRATTSRLQPCWTPDKGWH